MNYENANKVTASLQYGTLLLIDVVSYAACMSWYIPVHICHTSK